MKQHRTAILLSIYTGVLAQSDYDMPQPRAEGGGGSSGGSSSAPAVIVSPGLGLPRPSFDRALFSRIKLTHGVMAAMAFAAFFPLGAIAIRTKPGRFALFAHLGLQILAFAFFAVAVAMGMWMSATLEPFGADFWNEPHAIIGLTVFGLLAVQAILGIIHHLIYRRKGKRQVWSYAHVWNGRILITLGIINGGLGMQLASVSRAGKIAYGVCAGLIWVVWMVIAVISDFKEKPKADEKPVAESEVK
ncbi:Cytochrome b2 [Venturia nashicola]|nr:Cytochrome b2 [Venturia nashicola]